MKIEIDTHSHTLVSGHAYNTLKEMAKAAAQKGLKGLAVTDHAPNMPGTTHLYYFQNMCVVPRSMYGIELLLGAELNILDENGQVDLPASVIASLDLSIASIHVPCYEGPRTKESILNAYVGAMENENIDIIGHPDDGRFPVDYRELTAAAKRTETLLEVNNSSLRPGGFRLNTRENTLEMLRHCKEQGVMVVLGTDSHVDATLGEYAYAEEVLKEADFPEELVANTTVEKLRASLKRSRI